MRIFIWIFIIVFTCSGHTLIAQSVHYSRHDQIGQLTAKLNSLTEPNKNVHSAFGNVYRVDIPEMNLDSLSTKSKGIYRKIYVDNQDLIDLDQSIERKGILRHFYRDKANLLSLEKEGIKVYLNPLIHISGGRDSGRSGAAFRNSRGFVMRGSIDEKAYFYTSLIETQASYLQYQSDRFDAANAIDGQGFFKPYKSEVSNLKGYDFLNAKAYFGLAVTQHINLELGHGNHFIGHGYHSLLLNDYSQNYFYVSLDTRVWKLHYKNIFAELAGITSNVSGVTRLLPKKYMAAHYLSYKPKSWLEIGIYEAVVFSRENNFEFQYLNPIIFYRTVEQFLDSPDNVLLGANAKITLFKKYHLYGQFILDELKVREVFDSAGWWGNKYGLQAGIYSYDFLNVDQLDIRIEGNLVRPFTYSHLWKLEEFPEVSTANYSHFSQPLAHPLGSNFHEIVATIGYSFTPRLRVNGKWLFAKQGQNILSSEEPPSIINYGSDILLPNGSREGNFGHTLLQGELRTISHVGLELNYDLYHNVTLQAAFSAHTDTSYKDNQINQYIGFGLMVNSINFQVDY